jgi:hypothetical protein
VRSGGGQSGGGRLESAGVGCEEVSESRVKSGLSLDVSMPVCPMSVLRHTERHQMSSKWSSAPSHYLDCPCMQHSSPLALVVSALSEAPRPCEYRPKGAL